MQPRTRPVHTMRVSRAGLEPDPIVRGVLCYTPHTCVLTLMLLICLKISLIFGFVLPAAFVTHPLVAD